MTSTVSVNGAVAVYPSGIQSVLTIKNVGSTTVFLDSAPIPKGSANGYPLGKNSSMIWDANRPLFAASISGVILLQENSGNVFDAQAIATGIVEGGLATSIADAILAGGLADSIANKISIAGAPNIQKQAVIYNTTSNTATLAVNLPDVSQWNTLELRISSLVNTTLNRFTVSSELVVCAIECGYAGAQVVPTSAGYNRIKIPIGGLTSYVFNLTRTIGSASYVVSVIGSTEVLPSRAGLPYVYVCAKANPPVLTSGATGVGTLAPCYPGINGVGSAWEVGGTDGTPQRVRIPFVAGVNRLTLWGISPVPANQVVFHFMDEVYGQMTDRLAWSGSTSMNETYYLPPLPLWLQYDLESTENYFGFSLTPDGR